MDGADVCITSRRPPDVTCGAAILDSRWRRRKWRQPRLGAAFSIPIVVVVENGDPSASGRHLGWPHLRNRKWGHPRWRPEAEGPPFFHHHHNGDRKGRPILLYYNCWFSTAKKCNVTYISIFHGNMFGDVLSILWYVIGTWYAEMVVCLCLSRHTMADIFITIIIVNSNPKALSHISSAHLEWSNSPFQTNKVY